MESSKLENLYLFVDAGSVVGQSVQGKCKLAMNILTPIKKTNSRRDNSCKLMFATLFYSRLTPHSATSVRFKLLQP